jgi:tetratricopeptide (TPR) repeat protein
LTEEAIRKAYAMRNRASERERLDLTAAYHQFATGDIEQAIRSCQAWKQTYPQDFVPHRILGFEYATLGRWEESAKEFGEANQIDPIQYLPYAGLMQDYMALNRLADAHAIYQEAQARGLGSGDLDGYRYLLAFVEGDAGMMAKIAPTQPLFESTGADTEAYFGHLGESPGAIAACCRHNCERCLAGSAVRQRDHGTTKRWRYVKAIYGSLRTHGERVVGCMVGGSCAGARRGLGTGWNASRWIRRGPPG